MAKKEKDLPKVTSLNDSDYIRALTSSGESVLIKKSDLFALATTEDAGLMSASDKKKQIKATSFRAYNYTQGVLIETNVQANNTTMFLLEFTVNSYGGGKPKRFIIQGYHYNSEDKIMQSSGSLICGSSISVSCFNYNNNLCFWLKQSSNFQTILIRGEFDSDKFFITNLQDSERPSNIRRLVEIVPS